ncbi:unnamed protein product [Parnassius mnemosyne]|uniref:EGF-like domain-containing protein n=1 Tax=Parnassius mnemosyne TaxID=213953 RepID=A0AAV1LW57_9NEOP
MQIYVWTCALLLACVSANNSDTQYVKSVKGGFGGKGYQYYAGENFAKYFGNHTQQSYDLRQNMGETVTNEVGVCYIEVPTASLVRDQAHIPAGNGSRPDLSRIRACCKGYIRNIHNYRICDPVCSQECVNALCSAPETCTCFPDHVKNLAGFCVPTCPIGCQNGHCAGGECLCKEGYRLDSESKYCLPSCRENCGGIGNCTAPNTCECRNGYKSTPEGSCKPVCDRCINGDCVAPNECRCRQGYDNNRGECVPHCSQGCAPNGRCVAPNVCEFPSTTTTSTIRPSVGLPNQPGQYPYQPGQYPNQYDHSKFQPGQSPYQPGQHPNQQGQPQYLPGQYPNQPGQYPNQPDQSKYQPGQSSYQQGHHQNQPGQPQNQHGQYPNQQGQYPNQPGQYSNQPGQYPNQPGQYSNQPGQHPNQPNQSQNQPGQYPYQPGQSPNQNMYQPGQDHQPGYPLYSGSQHIYPDGDVQVQCTVTCINGFCVEGNKCACNHGYVMDKEDPSGTRCLPNCPGGCPNGTCSAPNFCICNMGYFKDHSVKGKAVCVKRNRRSIDIDQEEPVDVAKLLVFKLPEY